VRGNTGKIIGIAITLVCLVLAFYQVNFQELYGALAGADYRLIVPAMLLWLVGYTPAAGPPRRACAGVPAAAPDRTA
jgi:hypothetical protein